MIRATTLLLTAAATHIYLEQENSNDAGMTKMTYDGNSKAFVQGWRDGWKWASKQSEFSSDEPAEKMEATLYGDIDNDPGETKAIAFSAPSLFSVSERKMDEQLLPDQHRSLALGMAFPEDME